MQSVEKNVSVENLEATRSGCWPQGARGLSFLPLSGCFQCSHVFPDKKKNLIGMYTGDTQGTKFSTRRKERGQNSDVNDHDDPLKKNERGGGGGVEDFELR